MPWQAVVAALAAAFSPWGLLIVTHLLGQPHPMRLALAFLASAAALTLAIGFAVVLALGSSGVDDTRRHRTVPAALDLALGVAILVFAPGPRPPTAPRQKRTAPRDGAARRRGPRRGDGIAFSALPLVTAFDCEGASRVDGGRAGGVTDRRPRPTHGREAPIVLFIIAPERTTSTWTTVNDWLAAHGRVIALGAATVVGTSLRSHRRHPPLVDGG